ncbi:MAG: hypothetical protein JRJ78_15685 [Deltaproteobacteria bacterium]|nr:hypothetical protein [Deltaproteobacteria bacterium]
MSVVSQRTLLENQTVPAGGSVTTDPIQFVGNPPVGYMSIYLSNSGDGEVKVEALGSNDLTNYLMPDGSSAIVTGFGKTSGPDNDGKGLYNVDMGMVVGGVKFKVTETGGINDANLTLVLVAQ